MKTSSLRVLGLVVLALLAQGGALAQMGRSKPVGKIKLYSELRGTFYVDGKAVKTMLPGDEALVEEASAGRHVIEVIGAGIDKWSKTVEVLPQNTTEAKALLAERPKEAKQPLGSYAVNREYTNPLVALSAEEKGIVAKVKKQLANQELKEARAALQQWLERSPNSAVANYYMGMSYLDAVPLTEDETARVTLLERAKEYFMKGIKGKNSSFAYSLAGVAEYSAYNKDMVRVDEYARNAYELQPSDVELLVVLAEAYLRSQSREGIDQATQLLTRSQTINAKNTATYIALGDVYNMQDIGDLAFSNYKKALEIDSNQVKANFAIGEYYVNNKKYAEGVPYLRKATVLDPKFAPAYAELGELFYLAKQYPAAKENYRKYVELRGNDLWARYRYCTFLYLAKDYETAITEINSVMKDTNTVVMQRLRVYCNYEAGRLPEARKQLDEYWANTKPESLIPKDYEYRGKIKIKEGKLNEGIEDIQTCLRMDPSRKELYTEMVTFCLQAKNYTKAIEIQEGRVKTEPTWQNYTILARLHNANNQPELADSMYKRVVQLNPNSITAWLERARYAYKQDPETEKGTALDFVEKVRELGEKDQAKNKEALVEAYGYLAYYHYNVKKDHATAKEFCEKTLALDPAQKRTEDLLKYLKDVENAKKQGGTPKK
jgi:tetratricopeptide (TPR) repeat protein